MYQKERISREKFYQKTPQLNMARSEITTRQVWRKADAVCFDVDCTLITEECIDELASYCGAGAEVKQW